MSAGTQAKRVRKSPADRRAEIVRAAASVALAEGLECVTLRRIGEQLGVRPGLVSHYFPAAEDLVAEAFGSAATTELDTLLPAERQETSPTRYLARFFAHAMGEAYDDISRLWLNARHLSRYRPVLRDRVGEQQAAWRGRLAGLIRDGVERGEFHSEEPELAAVQILVVLDGLGAHANTEAGSQPPAVTRMAVHTAERALGLPDGALTLDADAPDDTGETGKTAGAPGAGRASAP